MNKVLKNWEKIAQKTTDYLNRNLPEGITIDYDFYESMCSIVAKTYVLRKLNGNMIFRGVSLKGRNMERFGKEFISKSIQLVMDDEKDKIRFLYRKLKNDIINNVLPIEYFSQSKEIKKTPANYLKEKKTTQSWYELMLRTGRTIPIGNKCEYYINKNGTASFADEFDPKNPDHDIKYLLDKLNGYIRRLYDPSREENILTESEFREIFASEQPQMMLSFDNFRYSDYYCFLEKGKKWERLQSDEENDVQFVKNNPIDSFKTVQLFRTDNNEDEKHLSDLYFDLDSDITKELKETILKTDDIGEKLKLLKTVISKTSTDSKKIINYFIKNAGLKEEDFEIYFSGFKGFHIFIPREKFGITKGRTDLTYIYKTIAEKLEKELGLTTLDIGSIYSKRRMMRLPFSINKKSGLMKVPMRYNAFFADDMMTHLFNIEKSILEKQMPIEKLYDALCRIKPKRTENDIANTWYLNIVKEYEVSSTTFACKKPSYKFSKLKDYPECIKNVLEYGIRRGGDRNKATLVLATFFKEKGLSEKECFDIIKEWAIKIPSHLTSANKTVLINSTKTSIRTIYGGNRYFFSCASIRSLGTAQRRVTCLKSCLLAE